MYDKLFTHRINTIYYERSMKYCYYYYYTGNNYEIIKVMTL